MRDPKEALVALRNVLKPIAVAAGLLCVGAAAPVAPSFVPAFQQNFPDAFVLPYNGQFIAYSTNDGPNVPVAISSDLVHWSFAADPAKPSKQRDALPKLGAWA